MKVISLARGQGKTQKAVSIAIETGAYLLVHSRDEAVRLSQAHPELRFPITYDEFLDNRMKGSFVRNIVIDNADMFLRYICAGLNIEAITLDIGAA